MTLPWIFLDFHSDHYNKKISKKDRQDGFLSVRHFVIFPNKQS